MNNNKKKEKDEQDAFEIHNEYFGLDNSRFDKFKKDFKKNNSKEKNKKFTIIFVVLFILFLVYILYTNDFFKYLGPGKITES